VVVFVDQDLDRRRDRAHLAVDAVDRLLVVVRDHQIVAAVLAVEVVRDRQRATNVDVAVEVAGKITTNLLVAVAVAVDRGNLPRGRRKIVTRLMIAKIKTTRSTKTRQRVLPPRKLRTRRKMVILTAATMWAPAVLGIANAALALVQAKTKPKKAKTKIGKRTKTKTAAVPISRRKVIESKRTLLPRQLLRIKRRT